MKWIFIYRPFFSSFDYAPFMHDESAHLTLQMYNNQTHSKFLVSLSSTQPLLVGPVCLSPAWVPAVLTGTVVGKKTMKRKQWVGAPGLATWDLSGGFLLPALSAASPLFSSCLIPCIVVVVVGGKQLSRLSHPLPLSAYYCLSWEGRLQRCDLKKAGLTWGHGKFATWGLM